MNLKSTFPFIFILIFLSSCGGSKNFSASGSNDEIVYKAVKFLSKKPDDAYALGELKFNYARAVKNHEEKINSWRTSNDPQKWDKIIGELTALQNLYEAINTNARLISATKAQSYFNATVVAKDSAAAEAYQQGLFYLNNEGRENAREAYHYFQKANQYVNGYKDSRNKMKEAFDKSVVTVVINPVHDDNFFRSNWQTGGFGYNRDYLPQSLVRDLGGDHPTNNPAKFYTDWDARRLNIDPDWMIDLTWQNIYLPRPSESSYNRNRSKKIEIGKDTAGKPVYQTVNATLRITRLSYNATGDMEYQIRDLKQKSNLDLGRIPVSVNWQQEYASFTGDSRALDNSDWTLINNAQQQRYNSNEEILNELSRRVYYDLRNRIQQITSW